MGEDKTAEAGLDAIKGVCLGAAWVDLDQDGDLDLVVAKYADTPDQAAKLLATDLGRVRPDVREVGVQHRAAQPALVAQHQTAAVGELEHEAVPAGGD